ncbi:MAG TPA: hypothetical protein H9835_07870 [Candidatus Agathobaculum merdigallinarum]|nr:hypothetical protein [Candidatus Agathobaculum merdigallinarum]
MQPIEIARRMAELGQKEDAQKAYTVALTKEELAPIERFEAASYIFFSQGNYKTAYTALVALYNEGHFRDEVMKLLAQAFYQPNEDELRQRYAENCAALAAYPYFFRADFPDFDELPLHFFPFDDDGYLPFDPAENRFGEYINFNHPVIDRYFFKDLENPILAQDVYSQYQLEYLNDTVRKSEWIGRDNHVYLHYTDWEQFCAHLQCLELKPLLADEKFVFLVGEEIARYPINFAAEYGVDYSRYPVRPVGVQEVNRLIWHTQLAAHNGGDFFNEIFYGHPNIMSYESVMFDDISEQIKKIRVRFYKHTLGNMVIHQQLAAIKRPTDKDFLVAYFLIKPDTSRWLDKNSRIAPALFFQPHFGNIRYELEVAEGDGYCALFSEEYEKIKKSSIFKGFKYIKTFTPIRRPTTSYAATVRFMVAQLGDPDNPVRIEDELANRILNRSYLREPDDRLLMDSALVRFEDGKLNPKAIFPVLAEFLDIPYTESMTYCSSRLGLNPESLKGNARGFDPATVYRTYDEYANDDERAFLEYFMRDIYEACGYSFHYYKGEPVDEAWAREKIEGFTTLNSYIIRSLRECYDGIRAKGVRMENDEQEITRNMDGMNQNRMRIAELLLKNPRFVTRQGQPLRMMEPLKLDPALLEQPLYH